LTRIQVACRFQRRKKPLKGPFSTHRIISSQSAEKKNQNQNHHA